MKRNLTHLLYFVTVARKCSFTKAAAQLGVSQPTLSYAVAELEKSTNILLLKRTTRYVTTTESGKRLLEAVGSHIDEIECELNKFSHTHSPLNRILRITCASHTLSVSLMEKLNILLQQHPEVSIELDHGYQYGEVSEGDVDAGIVLGHLSEKDIVCLPISPPVRMAVVGSNTYFSKHEIPLRPQDLLEHDCIQQVRPGEKIPSVWSFEKEGCTQNILISGQLCCQSSAQIITAILSDSGLAFLPEEDVLPFIREREMTQVLREWCHSLPGYYLIYSSRRKISEPLSWLIDALQEKRMN